MTGMPRGQVDEAWYRIYKAGGTLEEAAEPAGLTREGVRQRLLNRGETPRTQTETRQLQYRRLVAGRDDELRRAVFETRDLGAAAERAGLPKAVLARWAAANIPDVRVLLALARSPNKQYSEEEMLDSLRVAARSAGPGNLTSAVYAQFVDSGSRMADGRLRPGPQGVSLRFGSWRDALIAAGLPANAPSAVPRVFDDLASLDAVVACYQALGRPPTANLYDQWQRQQTDRPSGATVRHRFPSWNELLVKAWQIVYGVELPQDDEQVVLPPNVIGDTPAVLQPYVISTTTLRETDQVPLSDYLARERALSAHVRLQNELAMTVEAAGYKPLSPTGVGPLFDLAFLLDDRTLVVVEVKSAHQGNVELQLRLALGQVLRYAFELRRYFERVLPVIAIEQTSDDSVWADLFAYSKVGLIDGTTMNIDMNRLLQQWQSDLPDHSEPERGRR